MNNKNKPTIVSLLPIGVFLILYLGLGILFEYVMKIPMGFYNVPIVIAFPAAIVTLVLILVLSFQTPLAGAVEHSYHLLQILP